MLKCWDPSPDARPCFETLSHLIGEMLPVDLRQQFIDMNNVFEEMNHEYESIHPPYNINDMNDIIND